MTITILPTRNEYTSSASQTVFNYTFKIFEDTDLNVYQTPSGQTANDSTDLITAYTVSGVGDEDGGSITLTVGASAGDLITIVSDIPESRTTDYQNNGDFLPDVVNDDFDRVVSLAKQTEDRAGRTLAFQESQQGATALSLPSPESLKFLRWKSDLSGFENTSAMVTSVIPVTLLSDYDDLQDAITQIGASELDLWIDIDATLSGNLTVPVNVNLVFSKGNIITTGTHTLTINGQISVLNFQIFDTSGGGDVEIAARWNLWAEWWGAVPNDATVDDTAHIQSAIDCAEAMTVTGTVELLTGEYTISVTLTVLNTALVIEGQGHGSKESSEANNNTRLLWAGADSIPVITIGDGGTTTIFACQFKNFAIDGDLTTGVIGFLLDEKVSNCIFENVLVANVDVCWELRTSCFASRFHNCVSYNFANRGWRLKELNHNTVLFGCKAWGCSALSPLYSFDQGETDNSSGISLVGCDFEAWNVTYQIYSRESRGLTITGLYAEAKDANTTGIIKLGVAGSTQAEGVTISGGYRIGNSAALHDLALSDVDGVEIHGGFSAGFTTNFILATVGNVDNVNISASTRHSGIVSNWTGITKVQQLDGSKTYDPGNILDGAAESTTITVAGSVFGDFAMVSAPYDLQGIIATAYVSATNTVTIRLQNETGGALDLASGTWKVRVMKNEA